MRASVAFTWLTKAVVAPLTVAALALTLGAGAGAVPPPNQLKIEWSTDIDYVDPALAFFVPSWQIEYATCAKLLNYPDRGAPEGSLLKPEIATAMPTVSADGRTYTFQLRDDFFFSPPSNERVTAAHFKWAIDRDLRPQMASPAQPFLRDIVGASEVINGTALSASGVVASGNTLAITLVEPAGDFLARLAMPFVCPLPLSTPVETDGIAAPVPSAGPYYVEQWQRPTMGQPGAIVVKENPNYTGDRPHHFDVFQIGTQLPLETIKTNIDAGDTDMGDIPPAAHAEVGPRCGPGSAAALLGRQCYFIYAAPTVLYLAMNHDRPLFGAGGSLGNVALKKAVNFAIDRTFMIDRRGAFAGAPTDQHLPYGTSGFRDVDIYPARPDLGAARELAGCTGDTPDTCPDRAGVLYCSNLQPAVDQCLNVRAQLLQIGLDMEIKNFPRGEQFQRTGTRGEPFDMTLEGWHMDYLDPFDVLFLLDGEQLRPFNNVNFAYFNSPTFNAQIDAANALVGEARATAFGDLDVDLARDAAPWAPYGVPNDRYYFSDRIGCQTYVPAFVISLGALCLRPVIEIGDASVVEGSSGTSIASFTVTVSEVAPADYPFTVQWTTVPGSATDDDFTPASGELLFEAGNRSKTISIDVNGDTLHEGNEAFSVRLTNATKGTLVRARGTGTIRNDDEPPPGAPESQSASLASGQSLTTDVEGNGATPTDPLETTVQVPVAGVVSIEETAAGTPVGGYSILGHQVTIQAPDATAANPLRLEFRLDGSLTPSFEDLQIFRNGTLVADCTGAGATPDPCVAERSRIGDDARLIVLTSRASRWNFGYPDAAPPPPQPPPPPPPPASPPPPAPTPPVRPPAQARCVVPNVRGRTVPQARRMLTSRRCALGRVTRAYSARMGRGKIIRQSRRPGARLRRGTRVNVVVSRGPRRR